ncbi:MAG: hypothetical protein V1900_02380 [Candidatus Aenigmatarchaeota archaeon]
MRYFLAFLLLISSLAFAETNGTINLTYVQVPEVTGLTGYSIQYCNATSECMDVGRYKCFIDYDNVSAGGKKGWCNSSSVTGCYHDGGNFSTSTTTCYGLLVMTCTNGNWSMTTNCNATNTTCSAGACTTSTTTTTSGTTLQTTTNTTTGKLASITITTYINDFNLTQNTSATKSLTIKNNGALNLYNISISLSGFDWYTMAVSKFANLSINSSVTFTITFSAPASAAVKTYGITTSISTSNVSVTAASKFNINVLPSAETVAQDILPKYQNYTSLFDTLKNEILSIEGRGANVTDLWSAYNAIKDKLTQANASMDKSDYFTANQLLDDVKNKIDELKSKISTAAIPAGTDLTLIIIIGVVVVIVIGVVVYMMMPAKGAEKMWKPKEESKIKSILKRLKIKRKEKGEKFNYEFRSK